MADHEKHITAAWNAHGNPHTFEFGGRALLLFDSGPPVLVLVFGNGQGSDLPSSLAGLTDLLHIFIPCRNWASDLTDVRQLFKGQGNFDVYYSFIFLGSFSFFLYFLFPFNICC